MTKEQTKGLRPTSTKTWASIVGHMWMNPVLPGVRKSGREMQAFLLNLDVHRDHLRRGRLPVSNEQTTASATVLVLAPPAASAQPSTGCQPVAQPRRTPPALP